MVGTQGRHAPGIVHLKNLIAEGYIGRPLFFRMAHLLPRFPGALRTLVVGYGGGA